MPAFANTFPLAAMQNTMIEYSRNIGIEFFFLRFFGFVGVVSVVISLLLGHHWTASTLALSVLFIALIRITKLTLKKGSLEVVRYYFFACKKSAVLIHQNSNFKGELFHNEDLDNTDTDSILDIVLIAIPFIYKKYSLWVKDNQEGIHMIVKLSHNEFSILQSASKVDQALPLTLYWQKRASIPK